jgi:hypothetical protein
MLQLLCYATSLTSTRVDDVQATAIENGILSAPNSRKWFPLFCIGGLNLPHHQCDWLLGHWLQSLLSTLLDF